MTLKKKVLSSERFKILYNIERIKRSTKISDRLDKYDLKNTWQRKKVCLRVKHQWKSNYFSWKDKTEICTCKFYKETVENSSYFNKENVFTIRNKKKKMIKRPLIG